jgi:hypothetical protein
MVQRIPWVQDGMLRLPEPSGVPEIEVGTPSWVSWLADPASRSFSFRGRCGTFTARKDSATTDGSTMVVWGDS